MLRALLQPAKKTFQILQQITSSGATDLSVVATNSSKGASKVYEELAAIVENIVFEMTEIMVSQAFWFN